MTVDAVLGRVSSLARLGWKGVLARSPRMSNAWTSVLLVSMIVGGVVLRIQNIDCLRKYGFDEHQYAGVAHHYLLGIPDLTNCHPPLSPLLISAGMLLMGHNPVGWRFIPLCFGIQSIVLAYWIASSLFEDRRAGWLAAAFMAADGFFITYSRAALPDGVLACLTLWIMLAAVTARGWGGVLACAVLVGAAASIKWVGLLAGLPACFAILMLKRAPWYSIASFAVVPFVHLAIWMIGLEVMGHPSDPKAALEVIDQLHNTHLGFPHHTNRLESIWYTWLVLYHPIVVKISYWGDKIRLASSVGNPLLWVTADLCLLGLPLAGGAMAMRARWRERWVQWFDVRATKALAILGVTWLSMMLLWMTERIVTYWYHYLTSWGFALLLLAGVVARLDRRFPRVVLIFVLLVLVVAVYFAPVWGEIPISVSAAHRRMPFATWW